MNLDTNKKKRGNIRCFLKNKQNESCEAVKETRRRPAKRMIEAFRSEKHNAQIEKQKSNRKKKKQDSLARNKQGRGREKKRENAR